MTTFETPRSVAGSLPAAARPLRIGMAHVDLPNESKGGVAYQAHYLANALAARGHQVTMHTFSPAWNDCHYRVVTLPLPARLRPLASFALAWRLRAVDWREFDVAHTHGDNYLMGSVHPQVRTLHGSARDEARSARSWKRRVYQRVIYRLERRGVGIADRCVAVSRNSLTEYPHLNTVIPCGVDLSRFRPARQSDKTPHPTLLFVGTAQGRKRGQWLADLFVREIRPRLPSAELWSVADAPLMGEGIVNYGRVDTETLTGLYRQAWTFCLPSTYEGFGVPYIEAMASGTPAVATPNPGACEVLAEGAHGIVADDSLLASRLRELLEDAALRTDYTARGLQRAQDFGWERVTAQYEAVYDELQTKAQTQRMARPGAA